ncbi:NtrZ family periplasmic regulatory protein [Phenylobacterium sp.]|jgi:hypothetical protein|uniref:NtrZ family periplasmic regulatory protein n=1 Tax=Phenylobacterium sp. TaxID=1871053 RepID=UPI002F93558E
MSARRIAFLIAAAALFGATAADAQPKPKVDFTVRQDSPGSLTGSKTLTWDARLRKWGLTFNLGQSDARPSTANDVAAGAYYRITPSLRVGGSVALGDQKVVPGPKKPDPADGQPRVRLESVFKF